MLRNKNLYEFNAYDFHIMFLYFVVVKVFVRNFIDHIVLFGIHLCILEIVRLLGYICKWFDN